MRRLRGVDAARAVALLGMMSVHVLPDVDDSGQTTLAFLVFSGRASALFALLAGLGLALATGGERPQLRPRRAVGAAVLTRALVVAYIGLALGTLDTPVAVILTNYGLLFAILLVFIGLRPRTLFVLAGVWVVATPLLSHALRMHLPVEHGADPSFADLAHPVRLLTRLVLTGNYPVLQWTAYLLVGLALGRLPLRRTSTAVAVALSGLSLAVLSRVASDVLLARGFPALGGTEELDPLTQLQTYAKNGVPPTDTWWWQAVAAPHTATPFDLAHTIGTALLVLGLALMLERLLERSSIRALAVLRAPFAVLAAAGSMTLTLYTLHVLALWLKIGPEGERALLLVHVSAALALAGLWKSFAPRGPLEAVVAQASRRTAAIATQGARPRGARASQVHRDRETPGTAGPVGHQGERSQSRRPSAGKQPDAEM